MQWALSTFTHVLAWPVAVVCSAAHTQNTCTVSHARSRHTLLLNVLQQVKEILVEESNVQPVNAPVTVSAVCACV